MRVGIELEPILRNRSGIGWYTFNLAREIMLNKKSNVEVVGNIFDPIYINGYERYCKQLKLIPNISPYFDYRIYRRIWNYVPIKYNLLFSKKADIYHFFNFIIPPNIEGKVITTVHDMVYKKYPKTMTKSNIRRLENNLQRSLDRADIIITISESAKQDLIDYFPAAKEKIKIVSPGVDNEQYKKKYPQPIVSSVLDKFRIKNKMYLIYVGTIEPRKNVETIIDGFIYYIKTFNDKDMILLLVGNKSWGYNNVTKKVQQYGMEDRIRFTGYVKEDEKIILYQNAFLTLFISLYEGFGMPIIESMASGTPVITSNISSMPEIAGGSAILINPRSREELGTAINELKYNNVLRDKLIDNGYQRAKCFTWKESAVKIISIYEELYKK